MLRQIFKTRRLIVAAVVSTAVLSVCGVAYGFFSTNVGTSYVSVDGLASSLTVAADDPIGGALQPGTGTDTIDFTVSNQTNTNETLIAETYALTTDNAGGVFDILSSTFIDGCKATWFDISGGDGGVPLPARLSPGNALSFGAVTVTMPSNINTDQNSCEGLEPQVDITAS